MGWTALVALKRAADRKTRLAHRLSSAERIALSDHLAAHVIDVLGGAPTVERVVLLSPEPVSHLAPTWITDRGRGLNVELDAARKGIAGPLLVLHPDLPFLVADDVAVLIDAALQHGLALAPDRHGSGTNAVAIAREARFSFAFGAASLAAHVAAAACAPAIVRRRGLAFDLDTPDDLDAAAAEGFAG